MLKNHPQQSAELGHLALSQKPAALLDAARRDQEAINFNRSVLNRLEMIQAPHEGALARPRWPDNGNGGTLIHIEIDTSQDFELAESLPNARKAYERLNRLIELHRLLERTVEQTHVLEREGLDLECHGSVRLQPDSTGRTEARHYSQ